VDGNLQPIVPTYVQVKRLKDLAFTSEQLLDLFIVFVVIFSFQNIEIHLNGEDEGWGVQMKHNGFLI
jgi:hypothetical protein